MLEAVGIAAVVEGASVARDEPDRLVVILNRAVVFAFATVGVTAVEKSGGELRVEPDRLVVVLNGAIELLPGVESDASVVEGAS